MQQVLVLSAKTTDEADILLDTLKEEKLYEDKYNWVIIKTEDDLELLNYSDEINEDILSRFLTNNIVYIGTYQQD